MKKLLFFRADWCGPCRQMSPIISDVFETWVPANSYTLETVDIEKQPELASRMGIRGIPTMIIVDENGVEKSRQVGVMPRNKFQEWLATTSGMVAAAAPSSNDAERGAMVAGEYCELKSAGWISRIYNRLMIWFRSVTIIR